MTATRKAKVRITWTVEVMITVLMLVAIAAVVVLGAAVDALADWLHRRFHLLTAVLIALR